MADKWYSYINGTGRNYTNTTTNYLPNDWSQGLIPWDSTKYSNIVAVYIEIDASADSTGCLPNAVAGVICQLYNVSDSVAVTNFTSTGSNWEVRRSSDIKSSMPVGEKQLAIQWKKVCGTSVVSNSCRLVIVQEADSAPKTRICIPIGQYHPVIGSSYAKLSSASINNYERHWLWDEDKFATIDAIYFGITFKTTTGETGYARLDTVAGGSSISGSEVTTTNTAFEWQMSNDLKKANITDDTTYTTWMKTTGFLKSTWCASAFLIIDLSPVTKFQGTNTPQSTGFWDRATSYSEEVSFKSEYDNDWSGVTVAVYHEATMKVSAASTGKCQLYDDGGALAGTELTTTSTSFERQRSSSITEPADGSDIGISVKNSVGGRTNTKCANMCFVYDVSGITAVVTGTNMKINIGDVFKDVDSMKINIGDVFKDVTEVKQNIGDSWKTIF